MVVGTQHTCHWTKVRIARYPTQLCLLCFNHLSDMVRLMNSTVIHNDNRVWTQKWIHMVEKAINEPWKWVWIEWTFNYHNIEYSVKWDCRQYWIPNAWSIKKIQRDLVCHIPSSVDEYGLPHYALSFHCITIPSWDPAVTRTFINKHKLFGVIFEVDMKLICIVSILALFNCPTINLSKCYVQSENMLINLYLFLWVVHLSQHTPDGHGRNTQTKPFTCQDHSLPCAPRPSKIQHLSLNNLD